jgi:hypothetical protein
MLRFIMLLCLTFAVNVFASGNSNNDQMYVKQQLTSTITTTSTQILAFNADRKYLLIQNNGATNIIVKFNSVQSASEGIVITPGGSYVAEAKCPTGSVWIKSASATDSTTVIEGN